MKKTSKESGRIDTRLYHTAQGTLPRLARNFSTKVRRTTGTSRHKKTRPGATRSSGPPPVVRDLTPPLPPSSANPHLQDNAGAHAFKVVVETTNNLRHWARTQSSEGNISTEARMILEDNLITVIQATGEFRSVYDPAEGRCSGAELAVEILATTGTKGFNLLTQDTAQKLPIQAAPHTVGTERADGHKTTPANRNLQTSYHTFPTASTQTSDESVLFI